MTEVYLYPETSWNKAASASPHMWSAPELSPLMAHCWTHSNLGTPLLYQKRVGRRGKAATQQSDPDIDSWAPRLVLDLLAMLLPMEHSTDLAFTWYNDALLTCAEFSALQDLLHPFLITKKRTYPFLLPVFSRGNTNGPIILTNSFPHYPFVSLSLVLLHAFIST